MKHQEYAIDLIDCNPGLLVAFDLGTGKTMVALEWIHRALMRGEIHNALVICPPSLIPSWEEAIENCIRFEGYSPYDIDMMKKAITITSYQKTYRTEKTKKIFKTGQEYVKKTRSIRDEIDKVWDVVICDEAHNLGGHSSAQTKACITIARHAKKRIALTGTPLHGGGGKQDWEKMFGEIQFVTGAQQWLNWSHFCKELVISYDKWYKPERYNGGKCEKVFKEFSISCRRDDCVDLPGYTENDIKTDLIEKKMYKDLLKGDVAKYNITCETSGTQYLKLLQIVSGSCKTDNGTLEFASAKDDALKDIIAGSDEKIIVFCQYRASIDRCVKLGKELGRRVVAFDGRSKTETWKEFRDGKYDMLVIQYDSGSAGLNLQNAHICVFFEPTLSALKLEQAAGRIYRSGQSTKCAYYYITTVGTIESKVWNLVRSGKDINNDMLVQLAHGEL